MAKKNSPSANTARRARIAAEQAAERRRERRNRLLMRGGLGVAALAVVGGVIAIAADHGSGSASGSTGTVRWAAPADADAAVKSAGLQMLATEGTVVHIHSHLDVYVDGTKVQVPAEIGINQSTEQLSPLHSHDTSGVIHVESAEKKDFTLGEFMKEWQVALSTGQLGELKTDASHTLTAYVNGKAVTGDPSSVVLKAHDEIALVYGTASENATVQVPSSYTWTSGL